MNCFSPLLSPFQNSHAQTIILKAVFRIICLAFVFVVTPVSIVFAESYEIAGLLLFTSDRDGYEEIYKGRVTSLDIENITQLTFNKGKNNRARLSPDGTKIAFIRNENEIWMMDSQGGNQHFIHNGEDVGFSPDGNKLVFADSGSIYTCDLLAQKIFQVYASNIYQGYGRSPDWSPDGKNIIFQRTFVYSFPHVKNIILIGVGGGDGIYLTNYSDLNEGYANSPRWSPDGTKIIYGCDGKVCMMNADGSNQVYPFSLKIGGECTYPIWSPDAGWIIFNLDNSSRADFNGKLFATKLDLSKALSFSGDSQPGNNYPHDWKITSTPSTCTANIDSNLSLHIPYLSYDNGAMTLSADLFYYPNPTYPALMPFQLTNYSIINNPSFSCTASTLSSNLTIHIPDVLFPDGVTHLWVDLEYSPALSIDGKFYWTISNFGVVSN